MLRRFVKDSVIYAIPAIFSQGIGFFLIPIYTRVLSPIEYGVLDLFTVFGSFVNLTVAMEISQGIARHYREANSSKSKTQYASTAFWFTVFCYVIFASLSFYYLDCLAEFITGTKGNERVFQILIIYLSVNGLFYLIQNQFRWELRSKLYSLISIVFSLITALSAIVFTYFFKWGLEGILLGMLTGSLIATIIGLWNLKDSFRFRFNIKYLKQMLRFSIPLVPSGIAVFVSLYVDRIMLKYFLSLNEVGLYSIGYRLASISLLIMVGFRGALTPLIYKHYKEEATRGQLAVIFRYFIVFAILVFLGLALFAEEILWMLTTEAYYPAANLVTYMVPAILLANMYIFAPGIGIAKKTKYILYINVAGAIVNALLNWFFIPNFGMEGAAIATLTGSLLVFILYMVFSQKLYYVPHQWRPIILSILFTSFIVIMGVGPFYKEASFVSLVILRIALIFLAFMFFIMIKMIRWEEIQQGIKLVRYRLFYKGEI